MDALAWRIARTVYPFLALTAFIGVCLNSILLLTTLRTKSLRSTANILIGSCAAFDVLHQTGYFVFFPILFSDYYIDSFYCTCMQFLPELGMGAGAFCVLCIGIDRALSAAYPLGYNRLGSKQLLKYQFLAIALFCCWTAYLMIAYWTPKKLICGMPSPFHGSALALWSRSLHLVNLASALLYFITWRTLIRKSLSASAKRIFTSMAIVMTFEVTAWFISTALINLSQIIALPEHRPPFHYVACLFVNIGIAFKTVIYYLISSDYRQAIRIFLGLKKTTSILVNSNSDMSTITTI